jgi:hypothetical protein
MRRQNIVGYHVFHAGARVNDPHRARRPLLRYPDVQTRTFAVSSCHHRATPGPQYSAQVAWMTLRLWRAGFVVGASVVPLVTVDEGEGDQACGVHQRGHHPDGLYGQTRAVSHSPQLPAHRVAP